MRSIKSQSGRSLLEMLAVLAIVAVVTMVGLVGYSFVVKLYRENKTVEEISELAVRYKLNPVKADDGKFVQLKSVYPQAVRADALTMRTPDTPEARVSLQVFENSSSFAVVVDKVLDDSCRKIIEKADYDVIVAGSDIEAEEATKINAYGRDYLLNDPEGQKIAKKLCAQTTEKHNIGTMGLIGGGDCPTMGGSYWYGGRCWNCASDREQDSYGNCCAKGQVDVCGFCPGKCPNGGVCNTATKVCVECLSDDNCAGRTDGKLKCDLSSYRCVECTNVGQLCAGTGPGTGIVDKYCTKNHICQECDTTQHMRWNRDLDICECATPLIPVGGTCYGGCCAEGTTCHDGVCLGCWTDYDPENPTKEGSCRSDRPLCQGGICQGCPALGTEEGAPCMTRVCPGCQAGTGLSCVGDSSTAYGTCQCPEGSFWNSTLGKCTECRNDGDCAGNSESGKTRCDTSVGVCGCPADTYPDVNGNCLKCKPETQQGCSTPLPWCKAATVLAKTCVECLESAHCSANTSTGKTECSASNVCQCPVATSVWNSALNRCTECSASDKHLCTSEKPLCDTNEGVCVECISDSDCPDTTKPYCDLETKTCTSCPKTAPYPFNGGCLQCIPETKQGCTAAHPWCKASTLTSKTCVNCFIANGKTYGCNVEEGEYCNETANSGLGACVCDAHDFGEVCGCGCKKGLTCDEESGKCICASGRWDGSTCVECLEDTDCEARNDLKTVCSPTSHVCTCPSGTFWNAAANRCTECLANYGSRRGACPTENKPMCDVTTWTCEACPRGTFWNATAGICTQCLTNYGAGYGACPILGAPYCDKISWMCGPCPDGYSYNQATHQCEPQRTPGEVVYESDNGGCAQLKCSYCGGCSSCGGSCAKSATVTLDPGYYEVIVIGAGGGSAGAANGHGDPNRGMGATGGSGASFRGILHVTRKENFSVKTGVGGRASNEGGTGTGGTGGASEISGLVSCPGGKGGNITGKGDGEQYGGSGAAACSVQSSKFTSISVNAKGKKGLGGRCKHTGCSSTLSGTSPAIRVEKNYGGVCGITYAFKTKKRSIYPGNCGYVKITYKGTTP